MPLHAGAFTKFAASAWGKKLAAQQAKANQNDFDRFKATLAKVIGGHPGITRISVRVHTWLWHARTNRTAVTEICQSIAVSGIGYLYLESGPILLSEILDSTQDLSHAGS